MSNRCQEMSKRCQIDEESAKRTTNTLKFSAIKIE